MGTGSVETAVLPIAEAITIESLPGLLELLEVAAVTVLPRLLHCTKTLDSHRPDVEGSGLCRLH